jgi:hypothetical protein
MASSWRTISRSRPCSMLGSSGPSSNTDTTGNRRNEREDFTGYHFTSRIIARCSGPVRRESHSMREKSSMAFPMWHEHRPISPKFRVHGEVSMANLAGVVGRDAHVLFTAVYFPEMWREFHDYLPLRQSETAISLKNNIIPDIRTNGWKTSWKRFINELIYLRGYSMLYPNYDDWLAFSTNHFEPGEHLVLDSPEKIAFREEQLLYFRVPLFPEESIMKRGMPMGLMPNWEQLPKLDFWGNFKTESQLRAVGRQQHKEVFPQIKPPTMEDDSNPWQSDFRAVSLLCSPDSNSTWCVEE